MRVLVTGHLGYIGPVMVRCFRAAGHHVTGLDTGYFQDCIEAEPKDSGAVAGRPDAEIVKDIRTVDRADLEGFDAIVHLSALSNDPMGELNEALTADINFKASVRLATLAKQAGVGRFIFASSCSLYGAAGGEAPLTETAAMNPVSAYAVSKVRTEEAVSPLADKHFSPVFMRNATAYGVSPRLRLDLVVNNLMAWARTTGEIRVMSDGSPWRPIVHIEDISRAALAAAEAPREAIHNEAFNIGRNDANYRVRDIAEAVARQVPGSRLLITGETAGDLRSYRVDFSKALNHLPGFAPSWTLEQGCAELDRWFDRHEIDSTGFQSRRYIRLKQLRHLLDDGRLTDDLYWTAAVNPRYSAAARP
jgi:nucleoside-diphosphate-sugar epimerase